MILQKLDCIATKKKVMISVIDFNVILVIQAICNKKHNYFVFLPHKLPATILNVFRCLLQLKDIDIQNINFIAFDILVTIAIVIQRALFMHADL